jgi:hypothetical protein
MSCKIKTVLICIGLLLVAYSFLFTVIELFSLLITTVWVTDNIWWNRMSLYSLLFMIASLGCTFYELIIMLKKCV